MRSNVDREHVLGTCSLVTLLHPSPQAHTLQKHNDVPLLRHVSKIVSKLSDCPNNDTYRCATVHMHIHFHA